MIVNRLMFSSQILQATKQSLNRFPLIRVCSYQSTLKEKLSFKKNSSDNSRRWVKYAIGIPFLSGFVLYHYTKYKFLKYTVP